MGINRTWVESLAAVRIIGASDDLPGVQHLTLHDSPEVSRCWGTFFPHLAEVATVVNSEVHGNSTLQTMYGALYVVGDSSTYVAGIEVPDETQIPMGLSEHHLPSGLYFIAEFIGSMSNFPAAVSEIYQHHVPEIGKSMNSRPHLEMYPPGFDQPSPTARVLIAIPTA